MSSKPATLVAPTGVTSVRALALAALLAVAPAPRLAAQAYETHHPSRILVIPKPGRENLLRQFHQGERTRVRRVLRQVGDIHVIELPPGRDPVEAVARFRRSGHVLLAELDGVLEAAAVPSDPQFNGGSQWGLYNFGQGNFANDADVDAELAWDIRTSATNIIVAVVDSGARLTHLDLASNLWVNPDEIPGNGADNDNNGYVDDIHGIDAFSNTGTPTDGYFHGTHVAGIIGAVGDNAFGMSGIFWRGRMMICRFLNNSGNGFVSDAVECINYAIAKGAKVINASFVARRVDLTASEFNALERAMESCRTNGIIVVAAAGNSANNNDVIAYYPASYAQTNIVSVMATTPLDLVWGQSNYGAQSVDLGAPGNGIYSTWFASDTSFGELSGTSMAAAFVSGAIALVWSHYPDEPYWRIINRVLAGVDPVPALAGRCVTGGRLNVRNALDARPRLTVERAATPGEYEIRLWGPPQETFVLERSADYVNWIPVATNATPLNGRISFAPVTTTGPGPTLFRAVAR